MKIHLWCPGIEPNAGGIEKYSSFLLQVLREQIGHAAISVFAKNDYVPPESRTSERNNIVGTGRVPPQLRTAAFSAVVAARALTDRPDLIITTHLNFTPLARELKGRLNIPYWTSLHGIEAWGLGNTSRRRGLVGADLLLPVSSYTRDVVAKEQEIPQERFRVLPNAFDPQEFRIGPKPEYLLKRYGLAPNQPVILTVGRLSAAERYKGQDRILRILSEVRSQLSEISGDRPVGDLRPPSSVLRHIVVGDGDDRPRLEALAEELGVREMVIFAGKVPAEELNDHYNLCDLFAMPSTGEGFGIVFLESLACGKPVIAGNKDASRDALLDGELGVLVDPDNPAELRETIVAVLTEVERRKADGDLSAPGSGLPALSSTLKIPEIVFQPEELRRKVIENFGYQRFKETLRGYLEEFFPQGKEE